MSKIRMATIWLDGCSGCHMSLLDTDERLLELTRGADLVYSPLVDAKEFPEGVDLTLVEGAVSSEEDLAKIRKVRDRTRLLIAFGDCAVNGNIPALRNTHSAESVLRRTYVENADVNGGIPREEVPALLDRVRPIHDVVEVDLYLPGCPPPADLIYQVLTDVLDGRTPDLTGRFRFG